MEKYKITLKAHVSTFLETLALLALVASGIVVTTVLANYTDYLQNANIRIALEWLVFADLAFAFGYVYQLIWKKKHSK
jgi:hypothetical protein